MKRNPRNIAFIAGCRARLHRMRIVMSRIHPRSEAGIRNRKRILRAYRESFAEKAIRDEGGEIRNKE